MLPGVLRHLPGAGPQARLDRGRIQHQGTVQGRPTPRLGIKHRQEQVVLPLEVGVDRSGRVPGLLGDLIQGGAVEPPPKEDPQRGIEELRASLLLALGAGEPDSHME